MANYNTPRTNDGLEGFIEFLDLWATNGTPLSLSQMTDPGDLGCLAMDDVHPDLDPASMTCFIVAALNSAVEMSPSAQIAAGRALCQKIENNLGTEAAKYADILKGMIILR